MSALNPYPVRVVSLGDGKTLYDVSRYIKQGMMQQFLTGRVRLVCMSGFVPQKQHGKRATAERCTRKCGE